MKPKTAIMVLGVLAGIFAIAAIALIAYGFALAALAYTCISQADAPSDPCWFSHAYALMLAWYSQLAALVCALFSLASATGAGIVWWRTRKPRKDELGSAQAGDQSMA